MLCDHESYRLRKIKFHAYDRQLDDELCSSFSHDLFISSHACQTLLANWVLSQLIKLSNIALGKVKGACSQHAVPMRVNSVSTISDDINLDRKRYSMPLRCSKRKSKFAFHTWVCTCVRARVCPGRGNGFNEKEGDWRRGKRCSEVTKSRSCLLSAHLCTPYKNH